MGWGSADGITWSDGAAVDGRDCADLLDSGKGGLDWLHEAIHRYHEAVGHGLLSPLRIDGRGFPDGASIDTLYYAESDINTARMHAKADDLRRALSVAHALLASQTTAVRALPEAWRDSRAADAAHERLGAFTDHAAQQVAAVRTLQAQLPAAATAIYGFVKTKAAFVKGFDCSPDGRLWVAGHSMRLSGSSPSDDPVYWIIHGAAGNQGGNRSSCDADARIYDKIRGRFPNLPERPSDSVVTDEMLDAAQSICGEWVRQHFGPAVRTAVGEFVNQCAICGQGIRDVYETVKQAFDEIKPDRFPQPGFAGPQAAPSGVGFAPVALGGGLGPLVADGVALAELGEQMVAPLIAGADQIARQVEQWAENGPSLPGAQQPHDRPWGGPEHAGAVPHSEDPQPIPPTQPEGPPRAHSPSRDTGSGSTSGDSGGLSARWFPAGTPAPVEPAGPGRPAGGAPPAGTEADEAAAVRLHPSLSAQSRPAEKRPETAAPAPSDTDDTLVEPKPAPGARLGNAEPL